MFYNICFSRLDITWVRGRILVGIFLFRSQIKCNIFNNNFKTMFILCVCWIKFITELVVEMCYKNLKEKGVWRNILST